MVFKLIRAIIVGISIFTITPFGAMLVAWVLTGFNNKRSAIGNIGYCFTCLFYD